MSGSGATGLSGSRPTVPDDPLAAERPRLLHIITAYQKSRALYVVTKLGIADALADGPRVVHELADTVDVDGDALYRVMRALTGLGLFTEPEPGVFALTPTAHLLRSDVPGSLRNLALMHGEEQFQAWTEVLYSVRTGEPAFQHSRGQSYWEFLSDHREAASIFNGAMHHLTLMRLADLLTHHDFSSVRTLADIGGGDGSLLAGILKAHQHMVGFGLDLPAVMTSFDAVMEQAGVAARAKAVAGDFFAAIPGDADTYLLSAVLFDWNDSDALRLLSNVRAVMAADARLLIYENVIPDGQQNHYSKFFDIHMMVVMGGRARTVDEHERLLRKAGLELVRTAWGAYGTLLEARPAT